MNLKPAFAAVLAATAFLALLSATGQDSGTTNAVEMNIHRPLPVPDRVILNVTTDPARSLAVTWRTDTSVRAAKAQITLASPAPDIAKSAQTVDAATEPLITDLGTAHYHSVTFTGLKPATHYAYRVGDGSQWSEWFHTWTASDRAEPFSFIYLGDAQNDIKSLWSRVARAAYSEAPKARFIIHAGDLVNRATRDAEWGEWHQGAGWVNGMVPSIPVPGNHEYSTSGEDRRRRLTSHWRAQFNLPTNGVPGLEESCYYVDYQGMRIVGLNSNEKIEEQAQWLRSVLSNNPQRWTVVTFHHPVYSSARGRDNKEIRAAWKPIFDEFKVDLVLQGHDHTYARSNVGTGLNAVDGDTVYVVSVSGPKMYNLERNPVMRRAAEDTQLYQIIHVERDRLRYEARIATGELYDAFEIRKGRGGERRIVETFRKPTPERLRPKAEQAAK
jgi:hypothetical protein